jgi:hypothetical protein
MTYQQASFKGKPTHECQDQAKSDIDTCLSCCVAELESFYINNKELAPAPYFFERASAMLTKKKDWQRLIEMASRYLEAVEDYRENAPANSAQVWLSPKVEKIRARLENALSNIQD